MLKPPRPPAKHTPVPMSNSTACWHRVWVVWQYSNATQILVIIINVYLVELFVNSLKVNSKP